ncbi:MAG: DHH family phosphoesterase [Candidatus Diapherotrites archaeon]
MEQKKPYAAGVRFLSSLKNKKLLLVTHSGADVDAFGSAAAFYFAFGKTCKGITLLVPEHINLNAKALAEKMRVPYVHRLGAGTHISDFDCVIVLDLNSADMLGSFAASLGGFKKPVLLLDHHTRAGELPAHKVSAIIDRGAVSTSEIVYALFTAAKVKVTPKIAACLAAGIITDSAGFLVADKGTFRIMAELMEKAEMPYAELASLFKLKMDISEKIAKLKSARRCRIFGSGGFLVVSTEVSSFEASAASALVRLGADIAFAGAAEKGETRISARANNHFTLSTGFDFVRDIFIPLSREFPGNGGGHAAAAGFNGTGSNIQPLLERCVALSNDFISNKVPKSARKHLGADVPGASGFKEYK